MIPAGIALFAALIAVWGVLSHRATARRKTTMQHLADCDADRDLIEARQKFVELSIGNGGLALWAELDKEDSEESKAIRLVLNEFELVAVGIQFGIIDFEFYKRYNHGTVKRYWAKAAPFIHALRERIGSTTVYSEFETLHFWVSDDKKPKRNIWLKKLF